MIRLLSFGIKQGGTGLCLLLALLSCESVSTSPQQDYPKEKTKLHNLKLIQKGASLLKDGDLVLRTGNDFVSYALRQFSLTDKTYSHCGLVRKEGGHTWVYHAIGGEDNPDAVLRRVSLAAFCNPLHNLGFGIFRYELTDRDKQKLDSLVDLYYKEKIPFDMQFDLKTDSSFYCAEFVYKALQQATRWNDLPVSYLGDFKYVAIDNLFINRHTCTVFRARF